MSEQAGGYEVVAEYKDGESATSARDYAATHPVVCAHADQDGQGSHMLAPGEKCTRGRAEGQ